MKNDYIPLDEQIKQAEKIRDDQPPMPPTGEAGPGAKEILLEH